MPGEQPFDRQFGDLAVTQLIVMAGLPGAGKSTIGEIVGARLGATVVSVDPIESAVLRAGIDADQPTGLAAYLVAEEIARKELEAGRTVIVDAVNAAEAARLQWRDLAERTDARLRVIEVVCSDEGVHRSRLEKRERNLPHLDETTWRAVEQSLEGYAAWNGPSAALPRVTIDSVRSLGENVDAALAFIAS
ncbi:MULTISPECIES: ATP-binding protein [Agromyces]|uniref:ATP-binding protein n=1 Tax=Agromyces soli TaxID=659012 RepID=A0ABY4ASD5_9MICO|nr:MULTISPECIES: ATP-binding protein [Agromyces]MCD1573133.1 ATP-binding protein [Agromyces mediolanus]UOE25910.1 ATP-binding protein [Agromyces soli]GLU90519.1 adenylyl-sulfate kinase [Agromyces sp. NBRC 114283]